MKIRPKKLNKKDKLKPLDALYTAVATLKSREEVKRFLRDLLTESERIMIGRRILIAQMLLQDRSYDAIVREIHAGMDTIMRVQRWLHDESDGYEKTVKEMEKVMQKRQKKFDDKYGYKSDFDKIKRKYPLHFLLFNVFDQLGKK